MAGPPITSFPGLAFATTHLNPFEVVGPSLRPEDNGTQPVHQQH
jgi:hypothetical protein